MNDNIDSKFADNPDGSRDPLGLSALPELDPPGEDWASIRDHLLADQRQVRRKRLGLGLGLAACLMIFIGLGQYKGGNPLTPANPETEQLAAESTPDPLTDPAAARTDTLQDLIAISQILEQRLRFLRDETSTMPSEATMMVAELEDLVARVDGQLSYEPGSLELWSQRVNLMMDLEVLFQHQFEREYGRMASL